MAPHAGKGTGVTLFRIPWVALEFLVVHHVSPRAGKRTLVTPFRKRAAGRDADVAFWVVHGRRGRGTGTGHTPAGDRLVPRDALVYSEVCPLFGKDTGVTPARKAVAPLDAPVNAEVWPLAGMATGVTRLRKGVDGLDAAVE